MCLIRSESAVGCQERDAWRLVKYDEGVDERMEEVLSEKRVSLSCISDLLDRLACRERG